MDLQLPVLHLQWTHLRPQAYPSVDHSSLNAEASLAAAAAAASRHVVTRDAVAIAATVRGYSPYVSRICWPGIGPCCHAHVPRALPWPTCNFAQPNYDLSGEVEGHQLPCQFHCSYDRLN